VKSRPVATRILSITFMFLLFIALVALIFPAPGFPQSGVANDVKHDTPGQVIMARFEKLNLTRWNGGT
jgi:hypothetical protein